MRREPVHVWQQERLTPDERSRRVDCLDDHEGEVLLVLRTDRSAGPGLCAVPGGRGTQVGGVLPGDPTPRHPGDPAGRLSLGNSTTAAVSRARRHLPSRLPSRRSSLFPLGLVRLWCGFEYHTMGCCHLSVHTVCPFLRLKPRISEVLRKVGKASMTKGDL